MRRCREHSASQAVHGDPSLDSNLPVRALPLYTIGKAVTGTCWWPSSPRSSCILLLLLPAPPAAAASRRRRAALWLVAVVICIASLQKNLATIPPGRVASLIILRSHVGLPRTVFLDSTANAQSILSSTAAEKTRVIDDTEMTWTELGTDTEPSDLAVSSIQDPQCELAEEWQRKVHPVCNDFHAENLFQEATLIKGDGTWRNPWSMHDAATDQTTLWKTLKLKHYTDTDALIVMMERSRVEAVAMDQLTLSKHVVNVYGYCGMTIVNEFAPTSLSTHLKEKSSAEKLDLAIEITRGMVDLHAAAGSSNSRPALAHYDFKSDNVRFTVDNRPVMTDLNSAKLLKTHVVTHGTCPVISLGKGAPWRPPEEYLHKDQPKLIDPVKVDMYGLSNLYYLFAVGMEPWQIHQFYPVARPKRKAYRSIVLKRRKEGQPRFIPEDVWESTDPAVQRLVLATKACYQTDPAKRPSATQVLAILRNQAPTGTAI